MADLQEGSDEPPLKIVKKIGNKVDFLVTCDGYDFQVHKSVLSEHSDYFKILFDGETRMLESQENKINLQGLDIEVVKPLIEYMYNGIGCLHLTSENIEGFVDACSHLQISQLISFLSDWICKQYTVTSYTFLMHLAKKYSLTSAINGLHINLAKSFEAISKDMTLMEGIEPEDMMAIISKDCLQVSSEFILLKRVEKWIEKVSLDSEDQVALSTKLLSHIRYALMSSSELEILLQKNYPGAVVQLINAAHEYHTDFSKKWAVSEIQRRARSVEPSIVLMLRNTPLKCLELIACNKCSLTGGTNIFTIVSGHESSLKVCGIVTVQNCLYFVTVKEYGGFYSGNGSVVSVHCYDSASKKTHLLPAPPAQVAPAGVAALGDLLYLCGGQDILYSHSFVTHCQALDLNTLTWQTVAGLPSPTDGCAAASQAGALYVSGGHSYGPSRETIITDAVYALYQGSHEWVPKAKMRTGRRRHSMLSLGDSNLLVCGGLHATAGRKNEIPLELYDARVDQWSDITIAVSLKGPSTGHFVILPHMPKTLFSVGHEFYDANDNEIWAATLDDLNALTITNNRVAYELPSRYQLTDAHASFLYLNFNDQYYFKERKLLTRNSSSDEHQ